jgi:hypothetical protein
MPRRSRRAELALGALALALVHAAPAHAELAGGLDARPLFGIDGRYGGGVLADLWAGRGRFRVGGAAGMAALSADGAASSRVLTPLALSFALFPSIEQSGFVGIARVGGYLGAAKGGFIGGGFGSCAVGYGFALGEGASIRVLADVWGLVGRHGSVFFGPAVGLGF